MHLPFQRSGEFRQHERMDAGISARSQLAGAVSSLSLTLAGIITCIALSFLAQYI